MKSKKATVQKNIVMRITVFLSCVMIVMGIFVTVNMYHRIYQSLCEKIQTHTKKTAKNLEESFTFVSNTVVLAATEESTLKWLHDNTVFTDANSNKISNISSFRKEMRTILNYSSAWNQKGIAYMSVIENDRLVLYTYSIPVSRVQIESHIMNVYEGLKLGEGQERGIYYYVSPLSEDHKIYTVLKIESEKGSNLTFLLGINGKAIENAYEGRSDFETMKTCLFDSRGRVFHSKSKEAEDSAFQESPGFQSSGGIHVMRLGGEKYIYAAQKLKKSDFIIVNMIPEKDVIMAAVGELPFTVLSILFLFLAILVSGIGVSKRSTSFVNDLGNALNEVKNKNYDVRMKEYPNRAENELSRTFNEMTEKMKRLINEHYRARIMKQEIELELIQQQMNPHFLFNILTVIQIKAKLGGSDEIYQMLKALSGFMRGSLYTDKNNRVMLEKEIEYTEFYLYLQKQRFEEKLIYEIDVPQNLKKCQLPRLTIEPLAENAVIHGMEGTNRTLSVKITAKQQENYIEICVEDNGCGFNTAEVDLSVKDIGPEDKREKIGLNNTNNRLILLYGEECRLHITSEIGKGTKIWFKIPGEDGDNLCIR